MEPKRVWRSTSRPTRQIGARWNIAPLIERPAADGGTFAALDAKKK
jgi:hypothetical protein